MCGITGIVNFNSQPVSKAVLAKMTDAIAHRGLDGEGLFVENNIGLGHRRLAIIDLSAAAHQPMFSQNNQCVLTYNGEIYNFQALRAELEQLGYHFNSKTDSEVVLNAYIAWGSACVTRFNGMFAFAIWDKQRQELFIARDRYGIKPLYYTFVEQTFLFASEQKALLAYPELRKEIDLEGLLEYFTFQNIFTHKTLLKNIHVFPAGHWAKISPQQKDSQLHLVEYWDFNFVEPHHTKSENEYLAEFDHLFTQAVDRQLVADVGIGAYLSGGMDSGSITAVAAAKLPSIKTFTCGFDLRSVSGLELSFDERSKAKYISDLFKTEHYDMELKAGDMERALNKLVYHLEEPRVGQSYPNFYAAKLASKSVKVVLSGAGGDELFGGYPWRYYRAVNNNDFEHYIDKYYQFWHRLLPNAEIQKVFAPVWGQMKHVWTRDIFRDVFHKHAEQLRKPEDYVNHSLYFEAKTFLHGLLIVEDKLSMANGMETRLPFLDNDLVDFAMQVPAHLKLKNLTEVSRLNENELNKATKYFQKNRDGKLLLRKAMERYIPKEITQAEKQGFSAPDASWFKGESIEYVRSVLYDNNARIYEFMDPKAVSALVDDHMAGRQNRRLFIWSLLNFETWLKIFFA